MQKSSSKCGNHLKGGYTARGLGYNIFTQGDDREQLKAMTRDAVLCHF